MIIGITGYMRSGKDAAAEVLSHKYGYIRYGFGDTLRTELKQRFPMLLEELCELANEAERQVAAHRPLSTYKVYNINTLLQAKPTAAVRRLMQEYGTDVRRRDNPNHWVDAWKAGVRDLGMHDPFVVAPDVRFHNEAAVIREMGGVIWRIARPGVGASRHQSEQEQIDIQVDATIFNDGTLEELEAQVCNLWEVFGGKKQSGTPVRG